MLQGSSKRVSRKFQGYFKIVPKKIEGSLKEIQVISGKFSNVCNFQRCFKEISRVFQESF